MKKTNLKQDIKNIINHLKEAEEALSDHYIPGAPSRVRTALHLAEILEIALQYPAAMSAEIVDTDLELASDLHTYLGHSLQNKEVA